jgi:hypothetical protein
MAYIGVQPTDTYLSIASQQITGNGGATYTLNYSVSDEESVAVFVNNVRQNVSSYTVSGTSLTLGGTISASDECWVLFLGRTVGTKTPAVGSVTNDMLAGSIATSKLADGSTFATTNGITMADQWRLTTNFTGDANPIASNLERIDASGQGTLGTAMSESSGIFTFPSTGIYLVEFQVNSYNNTGNWYHSINIDITTDNSSYNTRAQGQAWGTNAGEPQTYYSSGNVKTLVDVTDTSNVKVRFSVDAFSSSTTTQGNTNVNLTFMTFIRLGDT